MKELVGVLGLLVTLWMLAGCTDVTSAITQGATMGTYYRITTRTAECNVAKSEIDEKLQNLNDHLSTYQEDSELSQINRNTSVESIPISSELGSVLLAAHTVWQHSEGAFDVTVGPLVNLWGFGPAEVHADTAPSAVEQAAARARVGMRHLDIAAGSVRKERADLYIDLSALAKGYAVDEVASLLMVSGCRNFMVDIGGEIYAGGSNAHGQAWRLGVEVPEASQLGQIQTVVLVSDQGVATSGDYRNFRMVDGKPVDHMLDPRIGKPATSRVASATVVHPSTMWADAYATAMMVLGEEAALKLANKLALPLYLIMATEDPTQPWRIRYNGAMAALLPSG